MVMHCDRAAAKTLCVRAVRDVSVCYSIYRASCPGPVLSGVQRTPLACHALDGNTFVPGRDPGSLRSPQAEVMTEQRAGLSRCCSRTSMQQPHQPAHITISFRPTDLGSGSGPYCTELTVGSHKAEHIFSSGKDSEREGRRRRKEKGI